MTATKSLRPRAARPFDLQSISPGVGRHLAIGGIFFAVSGPERQARLEQKSLARRSGG
jgi:hypothetical protein